MSLFDDEIVSLNDAIMGQFGDPVIHYSLYGVETERRAMIHENLQEMEDDTLMRLDEVSFLTSDGPVYVGEKIAFAGDEYRITCLTTRQGLAPGLMSFGIRKIYESEN